MTTRRDLLRGGAALVASSAVLNAGRAHNAQAQTTAPAHQAAPAAHTGVVTPNGSTMPWKMIDGRKTFHLTAEPVKREFAPGMTVNCWGYNGQTPGPTIEAVEGDRLRIYVTNKLPEATSIHWHGIFLPNGMDGVKGLTQPPIDPGKTFVYEFTLKQNGTFMYHPHADEMVQMALGMQGMFIIHPNTPHATSVQRDYCIMLNNWHVEPGAATPDPSIMTDFNLWTMNSRVFPGIAPLVARTGERVRIRVANLSMHDHPMHIHGVTMQVTGTDGGWLAPSAQWPETTVLVPVGGVRVMEFVADAPGDWPFHCHKSHHTMNAMGHGIANMLGVDARGVQEKISPMLPNYMHMGQHGMAEMAEMQMRLPANTLPMMTGDGPFGSIEMGGMFSMIKVRDDLAHNDYRDPGWYRHPPGTVAYEVDPKEVPRIG
jgi:FtsP/CotA-like multicopper oxidase with cupredoxin domain